MSEPRSTRPTGSAQPVGTGPTRSGEQDEHDGGHGHSVAAWTSVSVILVGCLVMAVAVVLAAVWLFVVGAVVTVVGAVLGKVLNAMGFGPTLSLDSAAEDEGQGQDPAQGGVR